MFASLLPIYIHVHLPMLVGPRFVLVFIKMALIYLQVVIALSDAFYHVKLL